MEGVETSWRLERADPKKRAWRSARAREGKSEGTNHTKRAGCTYRLGGWSHPDERAVGHASMLASPASSSPNIGARFPSADMWRQSCDRSEVALGLGSHLSTQVPPGPCLSPFISPGRRGRAHGSPGALKPSLRSRKRAAVGGTRTRVPPVKSEPSGAGKRPP